MPVDQGPAGVSEELHKFKHGQLHSGSAHGPVVTNRKQAIAIALNQAGMSNRKHSPKKRLGLREMRHHTNRAHGAY